MYPTLHEARTASLPTLDAWWLRLPRPTTHVERMVLATIRRRLLAAGLIEESRSAEARRQLFAASSRLDDAPGGALPCDEDRSAVVLIADGEASEYLTIQGSGGDGTSAPRDGDRAKDHEFGRSGGCVAQCGLSQFMPHKTGSAERGFDNEWTPSWAAVAVVAAVSVMIAFLLVASVSQ